MYKKLISFFLILISILFLLKTYYDKKYERSFKVSDTTSINKIFISDMKGNQIKLEKNDNIWFINDTYKVREDAISTLLSTIKTIEIQQPVSDNAYNNVIRNLATIGVKIDIYSNNLLKSYVIGHSTMNHLGTYMIMKDAENPFIMHIPGFNGFLSPRYGIEGNSLNISSWRDNTVLNISSENIIEIEFKNFKYLNKSFKLYPNEYKLKDFKNNFFKSNYIKTLNYINNFSNLKCESFKDITINKNDILYNINIKTKLKLFNLKVYSFNKKNNNANNSAPNVERYYAKINDGEVILIQKYVFNKLFISIDDLK